MRKPSSLIVLSILALLSAPLTAQTLLQPVHEKKKKTYPPLSIFRKKPKPRKSLAYGLPGSIQETHDRPVTDWTDRYELNEFLAAECGGKPKKPTEVEKIGATAANIGGKICAVIAALGVLGLTQKK